jgi:hypothetical protein
MIDRYNSRVISFLMRLLQPVVRHYFQFAEIVTHPLHAYNTPAR